MLDGQWLEFGRTRVFPFNRAGTKRTGTLR